MYFLFRFSQPERLRAAGILRQFHAVPDAPWKRRRRHILPSSWSAEIFAGTLVQARHRPGFLLRPAGELRDVFAGGGQLGFRRGLSRRLVQSPGIAPGPAQTRLARPPARSDNPAVSRRSPARSCSRTSRRSCAIPPSGRSCFSWPRLIVVYLYNFKVLPLDRSPMPAGTIRTHRFLRQLALAGFVLSAIAMRFAFPAVSLGRQSLLDAADLAHLAARIAVEQVLVEFHSAALAGRIAGFSQQSSAASAALDDDPVVDHDSS